MHSKCATLTLIMHCATKMYSLTFKFEFHKVVWQQILGGVVGFIPASSEFISKRKHERYYYNQSSFPEVITQMIMAHSVVLFDVDQFLAHSKNELMKWCGVRHLSVCNLLRKSLLLARKWPDRHQTFTRQTPGQRASRVCSRSRSRVSKVT